MTAISQRGSALLTAVVVVLVITVIGVGIVRFSARELAGAIATAQEQALVACAEAARQKLVAQFHALGFKPTSLEALSGTALGSTTGSGSTYAVGGHYDADYGTDTGKVQIVVDQVSYLSDKAFGPTTSVQDLTNSVPLIGQGGKPVRVVVHCVDGASGRQLEMEFGIRFGL